MKAIEDYLGVELFQRKSSPLRLSPAGERLLSTAYDVERQVMQCERDVARIADGKAGQLRIAVECHSCFDWLMSSNLNPKPRTSNPELCHRFPFEISNS